MDLSSSQQASEHAAEKKRVPDGTQVMLEQYRAVKEATKQKCRRFRQEHVEIMTQSGVPILTKMWVSDEPAREVAPKQVEVFKCETCGKEFDRRQKMLLHARFHAKLSQSMDYYDVESIMAEEEKLRVSFACDVYNFGCYLSSRAVKIRKTTPVSMPVFLISFLVRSGHCQILRSPLADHREVFEADPLAVDLENSHFFRTMSIFGDNEWLARMFFARIGSFVSVIASESVSDDDLAIMSAEEKQCVQAGRRTFHEFRRYLFKKRATM